MKSTGLVFAEKPSIGIEPIRLPDRSRFGNHGTYTNITDVQLPSGLWIRTFNGSSSTIIVAHNANQLLTTGGTIEAWIKAESYGEVQGKIVDKSTGVTGGDGYSLVVINGGYIRLYINGSARQSDVNAITFGDGNFSHVVVTWDNTGLCTFYVNGSQSGTPGIATDPAVITATNALTIGNRSGFTDRTFDGDIALSKVYNYVLSAEQVAAIFQNERHWFGV